MEACWARLRDARRTALIPYLTAGYPSPALSRTALEMVVEEGADLVELGMPFSDPIADGPIIQHANQVALASGMSVVRTLALVREAALEPPVVLFGYLNPVRAYGLRRFLDDAAAAGVSGLLLTDLPGGEDAAVEAAVQESSIALIRLVAPTTDAARCARLLRDARGFVYAVARLGVTGARTELSTEVRALVDRVRRVSSLPVAVGFGLADPAQAGAVARFADGVVVGSALVQRLVDGVAPARALVRALRAALDGVDGTREDVA